MGCWIYPKARRTIAYLPYLVRRFFSSRQLLFILLKELPTLGAAGRWVALSVGSLALPTESAVAPGGCRKGMEARVGRRPEYVGIHAARCSEGGKNRARTARVTG